jgi:hypothetical protein
MKKSSNTLMSKSMSPFPDFIIAGSAKSGTTAIHLMLDQHPDVYMSAIKETNYFIHGYESTRNYVEHRGQLTLENQSESDITDTLAKYETLFEGASEGQILGEASPWYLINDQVPERIKAHNPNTKVIVILRNPSDVAFANFVHQIRDRAESLSVEQIEEVFNPEHYKVKNLHPFASHLRLPEYSTHLPAYLNVFDPSVLHIMIYEEFLSDRSKAVGELFEFLGLSKDVPIDVDKRVNISGMPKSDKLQDYIQGSMRFKKLVGLVVSKKSRRKIRAVIEALNTGSKATMDDKIRKRFDDLYTKDLEFVESLFNREISSWREQRVL